MTPPKGRRRHIREECAYCGAQPGKRCKTNSGLESRVFHAAPLELDPKPEPYDGEVPAENIHLMEPMPANAHGKAPKVHIAPVETPRPEVDPEVAQLEQAITYHRGIDTFLSATLAQELATGRVRPTYKGTARSGKVNKRRAKNRVAAKSRKKNRR